MDEILEICNLLRLNHEKNHLNSPFTSKEIESVIRDLLTKKTPGTDGFNGEFYQIPKKDLCQSFSRFFKK